jgi:hypothetical protein
MKWWVTYPDGREEVILDVPNFDFNWQIQYEFTEPRRSLRAARSSGSASTTTRFATSGILALTSRSTGRSRAGMRCTSRLRNTRWTQTSRC